MLLVLLVILNVIAFNFAPISVTLGAMVVGGLIFGCIAALSAGKTTGVSIGMKFGLAASLFVYGLHLHDVIATALS